MIRAIIFDLDHCLMSPHEMGAGMLDPVDQAVNEASAGRLAQDVLQDASADWMTGSFESVARKHGFPEDVTAAARAAFSRLEVAVPLRGYADLPVLARLPVRRYLVTTGFQRLQRSKIRALGIEKLCDGVYIDAIDRPGRTGKKAIFAGILGSEGFGTHEVLVVGDSAESEIAAGNELGLATVQILREGVERSSAARHHVEDLEELERLLADLCRAC
jgi:putative hydrolase of the HAD superfamily